MDASDFTSVLGKLDTSSEVKGLFKKLGVKKKLKPPRGEPTAALSLYDRGVMLSFLELDEKSSELKFNSVRFYAAIDKFTAFPGELPKGVKLSDTRKEVRAKLGAPTHQVDEFNIEHWYLPTHHAMIRYRKDGTIGHFLWGLPGTPPED